MKSNELLEILKQNRELISLDETFRGFGDNTSISDYDLSSITESVGNLTTFRDIQDYLDANIDNLPVSRSSRSDGNKFNIRIGVDNGTEQFSVLFDNIHKYSGSYLDLDITVKEELDKSDFRDNITTNKNATIKSFKHIVAMTNSKAIYDANKKNAIKVLGDRFVVAKNTLDIVEHIEGKDSLESIITAVSSQGKLEGKSKEEIKVDIERATESWKKDRRPVIGTLGVCYDNRRKKLVLYFNPKFVMEASMIEWACNRKQFKSFADCYVYVLTFLFAHEMSHIIRHHTNKGGGLINDYSHQFSNMVEDSFINMYLAKLLKGSLSQSEVLLSSGIGSSIVTMTPKDSVGLKKYDSLHSLAKAVVGGLLKHLKLETNYIYRGDRLIINSGRLDNIDINEFIGSQVIIRFACSDLSLFGDNSSIYANIFNDVLRAVTEANVDVVNKKKEKQPEPEIMSLEGKVIREKTTGRIGIVKSDDGKGRIVVEFPDNPNDVWSMGGSSSRMSYTERTLFAQDITQKSEIIELGYSDIVVLNQKQPKQKGGMPQPPGGGGEMPQPKLPKGVDEEDYGDDEEDDEEDVEDDNKNSSGTGGTGGGSSQGGDDEEDENDDPNGGGGYNPDPLGDDEEDENGGSGVSPWQGGEDEDNGSQGGEGGDPSNGEDENKGGEDGKSSQGGDPSNGEDENKGGEPSNGEDNQNKSSQSSQSGGDGGENSSQGMDGSNSGVNDDSSSGNGGEGGSRYDGDSAKSLLDELADELSDDSLDIHSEISDDDTKKNQGNFGENTVDSKGLKDTLSEEEKKRVRDALNNALKSNPNMSDSEKNMLSNMGLQNITSVFKPNNGVGDWKEILTRLLDQALGMETFTNPDLPNKKIEDAPPEYEDDRPIIENILIMLDCSASMGGDKFKDAIKHMGNLFAAKRMDNVTFHLVPWGSDDFKELNNGYRRVIGDKNVGKMLISLQADMGGTDICSAFNYVSTKVRNPDMIVVLTDGEYNGYRGDVSRMKQYINNNNKRLVWVFSRKHDKNPTAMIDPSFKTHMVVLDK